VVSDARITAQSPAAPFAEMVSIQVSTPGGTSPTGADLFFYTGSIIPSLVG
jgi:hypothetical protein